MRIPTFHPEGDTIAAVSTPYGAGGIGIVRMSGKDAERVARGIFLPKRPHATLTSHRLAYGHIRDPHDGGLVDVREYEEGEFPLYAQAKREGITA